MVFKRLFISYTGKVSSLHSHCLGLRETELQAILLGDRASSHYNSFSGKLVLKRPFLVTLGRLSSFVQVLLGRQSFKPFFWEIELQAILPGDYRALSQSVLITSAV